MKNRVARRLSRRPARVCEHMHQVWGPHEGCAEFMSEPDEFPCLEIATREVRFLESSQVGRSVVRLRACAEHAALAAQMGAADPMTEAVLVRPLGGAR